MIYGARAFSCTSFYLGFDWHENMKSTKKKIISPIKKWQYILNVF